MINFTNLSYLNVTCPISKILSITHTHTHTHMHESNTLTTTICGSLDSVRDYRVSQYQKGKTNLDLLQQETVSQSGISWPYANLHLAPDR